MDVDRGHAHLVEKRPAEDLHVASEHEHVGVALQDLEHATLGLRLGAGAHRHVVVGHACGASLCLEIGMV